MQGYFASHPNRVESLTGLPPGVAPTFTPPVHPPAVQSQILNDNHNQSVSAGPIVGHPAEMQTAFHAPPQLYNPSPYLNPPPQHPPSGSVSTSFMAQSPSTTDGSLNPSIQVTTSVPTGSFSQGSPSFNMPKLSNKPTATSSSSSPPPPASSPSPPLVSHQPTESPSTASSQSAPLPSAPSSNSACAQSFLQSSLPFPKWFCLIPIHHNLLHHFQHIHLRKPLQILPTSFPSSTCYS
eukprot:TRINITY_DN1153_c0_g1_i1.p2 TRINITY_DN1153_c0_g1~~TRINITY_DN1153_c0_g1_i1.p2  ORF type:complete len:237 (-),score=50.05 TRINITY_DN1153_c0_g1_i1:308-1018(-)